MAKQSKTKKSSKIRVVRIRLNPLFLLVTIFLAIFLITGIANNVGRTETEIPVSEFLRNIQNDQYARLSLQDTGEIVAQSKYVYAASLLPVECAQPANTNPECIVEPKAAAFKRSNSDVGVEEIQLSELVTKFETTSLIDQLRSAINPDSESSVVELIASENFIIARTADLNSSDYLVRNANRVQLESVLLDNNISLGEAGVILTDLESASAELSYESLAARVRNSEVVAVYELDGVAYARLADRAIPTYIVKWDGGISSFARILQEEGISLSEANLEIGSVIVETVPWGDIISLITLVGFVLLGYFIIRGMNASGSGLMRFGQSKARMFIGIKPDITFKDVAGVDEAKNELEEIVEFLRFPGKFLKLGARIPKGVLMVGAPGTGKTLMARAIAGEAGVPFFHTSGSEFEEMLVGAGASRVRDLFEKAKKNAPALIFIDEIDAVARKRGTTIQSSTTEQTLNQILVEMDGFETGTNVIVIAATNRPDVLDPAILRPGRFDRRVTLDLPDINGRKQILTVHSRNKPLAKDVDLERVAKRTIGFSGAELENTLNEAAIIAAKAGKQEINAHDIEEAASKVTMGPVRRSLKRTEEELNLVAVHEAGHAVVAQLTPGADPVHRVSILSRGMAGGVTHFLPTDENRIISRSRLTSRLIVALGGRAAEEIALGDITTGASSDIQSATDIAKAMVQKFGMSDKLGLVKYGDTDANYWSELRDYSDDTARVIDEEVKRILAEAYEQAKKIIKANRHRFDQVVKLLLEKEVLEGTEFEAVFDNVTAEKTTEE